ncbi:MAG: hypothetical protein HC913_06470 [Microscillaceae bacterium]|nr:hypothetical protein [Microscillaceae bacterium]
MTNSESNKLTFFIGSMITMFVVALLMWAFLLMGAERIGVALLWLGVWVSIFFNLTTGYLGGSKGGKRQN